MSKIEIKPQEYPGYTQPYYRKLRGYAFDPSFSTSLTKRGVNEVIYKIKWEPTVEGPIGEYVEVVDYDPTKRKFYKPIFLENPYVLADNGLTPSDGDPRFHQQQVYAVTMNVIGQFEKALGRKIIWSVAQDNDSVNPTDEEPKKDGEEFKQESNEGHYKNIFIPRLRIYPHAMRQQNAYFSPSKNALLFGYFKAVESWDGNNVPGTTVFTCLSPDIVAHETTHAILNTIHPHLTKDTNTDMLAFHEGFADVIALLQRFTFKAVVEDQIKSSRGDMLSAENMLGDLAIQFGQAISTHQRALRSYLVEKVNDNWVSKVPNPTLFHTVTEPHARGGLLVAAIFDAFSRLYKFRVADLIRLASNGTGVLAQGEIDPDLVKRLAAEACSIADKLMLICIRALDYCPPVDLTFSDYLRALVTADVEFNPEDDEGLRYALLESFRAWGMIPEDVTTFSVESLKWKAPDELLNQLKEKPVDNENSLKFMKASVKFAFDQDYRESDSDDEKRKRPVYDDFYCKNQRRSENTRITLILGFIERILREDDREAIFYGSKCLSAQVHEIFKERILLHPGIEAFLGMEFKEITYTEKQATGEETEDFEPLKLTAAKREVFQVYKCRPMIIPDLKSGNSVKVMVIMFIQKVFVNLKGTRYKGYFPNDVFPFQGGASIIINMANYEIKYAINKNVNSSDRLFKQLEYAVNNLPDEGNQALMMQKDEPFAALHIH
jgi:hypothetical protein